MTVATVLYLIAVLLLVLAALPVPSGRVSLGWLGMAVAVFTFAIVPLIGR